MGLRAGSSLSSFPLSITCSPRLYAASNTIGDMTSLTLFCKRKQTYFTYAYRQANFYIQQLYIQLKQIFIVNTADRKQASLLPLFFSMPNRNKYIIPKQVRRFFFKKQVNKKISSSFGTYSWFHKSTGVFGTPINQRFFNKAKTFS